MSSKVRFIFNDKGVVDSLTDLHNKYVVAPANKVPLILSLCEKHTILTSTITQTTLHIHQHYILKRRFCPVISPLFHLLGYLLKMITLIYPLHIGYLSYISVRTNNPPCAVTFSWWGDCVSQ